LPRFRECFSDLEVEAGSPQLAGVEIVGALGTQAAGHCGGLVVVAVIKEPSRVVERDSPGRIIARLTRR
jgi:hypothetical protein